MTKTGSSLRRLGKTPNAGPTPRSPVPSMRHSGEGDALEMEGGLGRSSMVAGGGGTAWLQPPTSHSRRARRMRRSDRETAEKFLGPVASPDGSCTK